MSVRHGRGSVTGITISRREGLALPGLRFHLRAWHSDLIPELIAERGMMQAANGKRVKKSSAEKYAEAIRLLEEGHDSLKEICRKLGLVYNSVGGFVRRNYPELLKKVD